MNNKIPTPEENKPYKVFQTEEDWNREVTEAAKQFLSRYRQQSGGKGDSAESIKQQLLAEEAKIRETVPDFDLKSMLKSNPEFRERILKGYPVEEAFYMANRLNSEEQPPRKKIGIRENGRSAAMGAASNRNVANMSDEDFNKYIESIMGSKF